MSENFQGLKIVVDNQAAEGLTAEHGLSIWIEAGGRCILFDAGQESALESNTAQLGLDLRHIDAFVLSHGHYDHTGAVDYVMQENSDVPVYAHPSVFSRRYSLHPGKPPKEISMPPEERLIIANLPDSQLNWVREPRSIASGVYLTGPIPRAHPLEDTGGPFFIDSAGEEPDPIPDDMALWVETAQGLLVICGCCHSGLINTLNYIQEKSGGMHIWGIVGGLHLKHASVERLAATTEALRKFNPEFMVPCHCSGKDAIEHFKQNLTTHVRTGFSGFEL